MGTPSFSGRGGQDRARRVPFLTSGGGGGVLSAFGRFSGGGGGGGCCPANSTSGGGGGGCCPLLADSISEMSALSADSIRGRRVLNFYYKGGAMPPPWGRP